MTLPFDTNRDDLLEAYLDGLLDDAQKSAFAERLRKDPELARQVELQARIDGVLGQLFHAEAPSHEQLAAVLGAAAAPAASRILPSEARSDSAPGAAQQVGAPPSARRSAGRLYWAAACLAAAAAIAWVLAALTGNQPRENQPTFAAQPLVQIYQDAVASGFEPSYDCREPERFAATFSKRQGQPLRLLAMPAGMKMLGLAYTGGLSRETTAMLCEVDGQPVMAFVDRARDDQPSAAATSGEALHVFRQERDGLVYYEVTPLDQPRVIDLFAPATADGGAPPDSSL